LRGKKRNSILDYELRKGGTKRNMAGKRVVTDDSQGGIWRGGGGIRSILDDDCHRLELPNWDAGGGRRSGHQGGRVRVGFSHWGGLLGTRSIPSSLLKREIGASKGRGGDPRVFRKGSV